MLIQKRRSFELKVIQDYALVSASAEILFDKLILCAGAGATPKSSSRHQFKLFDKLLQRRLPAFDVKRRFFVFLPFFLIGRLR